MRRNKTVKNTKSVLLATAAAALFASGQVAAAEETGVTEAKVHCGGINACKGTSECKTATNACKGQNACAGQGFVILSKEDCETKGGKKLEE
jgi:hypothetical protein